MPWVWVTAGTLAARSCGFRENTSGSERDAAAAAAVVKDSSAFLADQAESCAVGPGAPDGMVWIPGGEFSMGAADPPMNDVGMKATTDSRPIHRVYVDGFWMDKIEVTNEQFAKF